LILDPAKAVQAARDMLNTRSERQPSTTVQQLFGLNNPISAPLPPLTTTPFVTKTKAESTVAQPPPEQQVKTPQSAEDACEDGISDGAWSELWKARAVSASEGMAANEGTAREAAELEQAECLRLDVLEDDRAKRDELKWQRETQRLKKVAQRQREQLEAGLKARRRRKAEKKARKQDAQVQAKLRQMGICEAGFRWINVGTGYRCAGGSHFMSNEQLDI